MKAWPDDIDEWTHHMHDAGGNEQQLKEILPNISVRNYVAVAPRGTRGDDNGSSERCSWSQSPEDIVLAEHRVLECVDHARERFNI